MSHMEIADNIAEEIGAIDEAQKAMKEKKRLLRNFVLCGEPFIQKPLVFDKLLSEWSDTLMTLVEAVGRSFDMEGKLGIQNPDPLDPNSEGYYTKVEGSDFTITRAAVLIAGIIGVVLICYWLQAPWTVGLACVGGFVVFAFIDKIVAALRKKPEEKEPNLSVLSGKISESVSKMRDEHVKACFRLKFKKPDPQRLTRNDTKEDKALHNYMQLVLEKLPRWCMNRIDDIDVECSGVAFSRKQVLYSYWRNSSPQNIQPPVSN